MNKKSLIFCLMLSFTIMPTARSASLVQRIWDAMKSCFQSKTAPINDSSEALLDQALEDIESSMYDSSLRYFCLESESALRVDNAKNILAALEKRQTALGKETLLKNTLVEHMQSFVGTISQAVHTRPATRHAAVISTKRTQQMLSPRTKIE